MKQEDGEEECSGEEAVEMRRDLEAPSKFR